MKRCINHIAALLFTLFSLLVHAQDGTKSIKPIPVTRKVALVIGNSNYKYIPSVPPASNDADDTAQAFRNLHFDTVIVKKDLNADALIAEIGRFSRVVVQAGDLAVIYYSGHGGQVGEENYLLPIDYDPPSDDDLVERRAYKMSRLRDALEKTGARIRVLIFDACRNSPVTTSKSGSSGLRAIDGKPEGTLIAFASAHNQVARYDGSRNSFYTSALLGELRKSGVDLKAIFESAQNLVYERTSHQQTPYLYGFLSGPLYLAGAPGGPSIPPAAPAASAGTPKSAGDDAAREAWELSKSTKNRAMLEAIVKEFPDSPYARLARVELAGMGPEPGDRKTADGIYLRGKTALDRKDYAGAMTFLLQAADMGQADAMKDVGRLYAEGLGVTPNFTMAMNWYKKAVDAGSPGAMNNIGVLYLRGNGVPKDINSAIEWFTKAADAGVAPAMHNLGNLYRSGDGVTLDYSEAIRWFRKGSDARDASSMNSLASMYFRGLGVTTDKTEALRWYRKSAEAGDAVGMRSVGVLYDDGTGVKQDYKEAMRWYRKAADADDTRAKLRIGLMYHNGRGVTQDYAEAMRWYRNAADGGDVAGMTNIGILYDHGLGVNQDPAEALRWFRKAADGGEPTAMVNLGIFYENGRAVAADRRQAIEWYRKAAQKGNENALTALRRLGVTP